MKLVVDSTVWSLAIRRRPGDLSASEQLLVAAWRAAVDEDDVVLLGPVRQEVLSGVRTGEAYLRLRDALRDFADESIGTADYERAAEMANACVVRGIQGSPTDFLVCSIAVRLDAPVLTADREFARYSSVLPVRTHRN